LRAGSVIVGSSEKWNVTGLGVLNDSIVPVGESKFMHQVAGDIVFVSTPKPLSGHRLAQAALS
jgi:hypothetical protein